MSDIETTPVPAPEQSGDRPPLNSKESPMSRLKAMWRNEFTDAERDYWHEQFANPVMMQREMRAEIKKRYQIHFVGDVQIRRLMEWVAEEYRLGEKAQRMKADEKNLLDAFPNATKDEIREKLLKLTYARIFSEGDFRLFIRAAEADVRIDTLLLNREKFKESLRAKIMAGIAGLAAEAGKNPAVKAAVEQLRQAIAPE